MRERMKRGKKPSENLSESTGKIGQAIDPMKPAPLMPSYDSSPDSAPRSSHVENPAADADSHGHRPSHTEDQPSSPPRQQQDSDRHRQHSDQQAHQRSAPAPDRGPSRRRDRRPSRSRREREATAPAESRVDSELEDSLSTEGAADLGAPSERSHGEATAGAKREPRGVVVLTIGLPGSGKTTWFKRRGVIPLSSDTLRQLLFDNETEQRYQGLVFSTLRSLLRARLISKRPMNYVDATNLSPHERRQWIKMARGFGYEVHAVFFDVPLELCLERNRKRHRQVGEDVMRQMASRLRPPTFKEGFSKIVVVRVKKGDDEPQS
jgi:predicted kinase